VKELASATAQNSAPVLVHAIPVFDVLPTTTGLGFLQMADMEPLKKIQACVTHESIDVRHVAIVTFSRLSLACTNVLFRQGLSQFIYESNEARMIAQQDVKSVLNDVWKLTLHAAEASPPEVAGTAFASLNHLFARRSNHVIQSLRANHNYMVLAVRHIEIDIYIFIYS
jgi:hypothetical protein